MSYTEGTRDKQQKNMHLTIRRRVWGISMEDFGDLWYGNSVGIPTGFFCGNGMGMGIDIQFPRQPCEKPRRKPEKPIITDRG